MNQTIREPLNCNIIVYFQMKYVVINGPYEITNLAKKLAHTYNLDFIDPVTASEEFLNFLVKRTFKVLYYILS